MSVPWSGRRQMQFLYVSTYREYKGGRITLLISAFNVPGCSSSCLLGNAHLPPHLSFRFLQGPGLRSPSPGSSSCVPHHSPLRMLVVLSFGHGIPIVWASGLCFPCVHPLSSSRAGRTQPPAVGEFPEPDLGGLTVEPQDLQRQSRPLPQPPLQLSAGLTFLHPEPCGCSKATFSPPKSFLFQHKHLHIP